MPERPAICLSLVVIAEHETDNYCPTARSIFTLSISQRTANCSQFEKEEEKAAVVPRKSFSHRPDLSTMDTSAWTCQALQQFPSARSMSEWAARETRRVDERTRWLHFIFCYLCACCLYSGNYNGPPEEEKQLMREQCVSLPRWLSIIEETACRASGRFSLSATF